MSAVVAHNKRTGYLIIAHGALAQEFLSSLRFIAGTEACVNFRAVAIDHAVDVEKARTMVEEAVRQVSGPEGTIILTDLFGGAPSNIALSLLAGTPVEIVAGVNLPMLLNATILDDGLSIHDKAQHLKIYGQNNIFLASDVLSGRAGKS